MIARKHVIRSGFSAAVSLLLTGVGHCMLVKRRGQVSPATVATWIISGRRRPTPVFFQLPDLTGSTRIPSYLDSSPHWTRQWLKFASNGVYLVRSFS